MKDVRTSHLCKSIAVGLWSTSAAFVAAAWFELLVVQPDDFSIPGMFAITATVLAIGAGTAHLRTGQVRLQRLIRITAGLTRDDDQTVPQDGRHLRSVL